MQNCSTLINFIIVTRVCPLSLHTPLTLTPFHSLSPSLSLAPSRPRMGIVASSVHCGCIYNILLYFILSSTHHKFPQGFMFSTAPLPLPLDPLVHWSAWSCVASFGIAIIYCIRISATGSLSWRLEDSQCLSRHCL